MRIEPLLTQDCVIRIEGAADSRAVFARLAEVASKSLGDDAPGSGVLLQALIDRESSGATVTPEGVAFPHAVIEGVARTALVVASLSPAVRFGGAGGQACDLVFAMFGDAERPWEHVRLLARLARLAHATDALGRLRAPGDAAGLFEALVEEDRRHV
ncbi:MAG: PTS sugar transporter subunit IIA [Planctomycetota bacterium]